MDEFQHLPPPPPPPLFLWKQTKITLLETINYLIKTLDVWQKE